MKKTIIIASCILAIICSVVLIVVLNNQPSEEIGAITGTVSYVKGLEYATDEPEHHHYVVYITPAGEEESRLWIPFLVSMETETESEYSTDVNNMPEFAAGSTVRIVYGEEIRDRYNIKMLGYKAISLTSVNDMDKEESDIPFSKREDYSFDDSIPPSEEDLGDVIHIAKMDGGYMLYFQSIYSLADDLKIYWIDDNTMMGEGERAALESQECGFRVEIDIIDVFPFDNFSARTVVSLSIKEK